MIQRNCCASLYRTGPASASPSRPGRKIDSAQVLRNAFKNPISRRRSHGTENAAIAPRSTTIPHSGHRSLSIPRRLYWHPGQKRFASTCGVVRSWSGIVAANLPCQIHFNDRKAAVGGLAIAVARLAGVDGRSCRCGCPFPRMNRCDSAGRTTRRVRLSGKVLRRTFCGL